MNGAKAIGALLLLFAGIRVGMGAWQFQHRRLAVLDRWIDLLRYIRSQIDCFLLPIDEILMRADATLLPVPVPSPVSLDCLLTDSNPYLDDESRRLLSTLIREIGGGYREEQLRRIDYVIDALLTLREKKQTEYPARAKVSISISICLSVGLAIVLW